MKTLRPKLLLRRESIRVLATIDLGRVAGGVVGSSDKEAATCAVAAGVVQAIQVPEA